MSILDHIFLNLFSIVLIIVILQNSIKTNELKISEYRLFNIILVIIIILLVADVMVKCTGNPNSIIYVICNKVGNFLVFILGPILPSIWLLYILAQLNEQNKKYIYPILIGINTVNIILVILTQFTGWYYYFDSNNIYYRGPIFIIYISIGLLLMIFSLALIIYYRKKLEKRKFYTLLSFYILPNIGIVLQVLYYNFMFYMLVISIIIIFLNIQTNNINTDYLTGVYNRKKLDIYLQERANNKKHNFSGILLDLDSLKLMNDTFGHDVGDEILKQVANVLQECFRPNGFIARYGGDEFFVVTNIVNWEQLEERIKQITTKIEEYNKKSPYKIRASIGYSIYDHNIYRDLKDFFKKIDNLMYENKKVKRN